MEGNVRVSLRAVAQHFESLEDPRSDINLRHPLVSVVVIAIMAVLAGADGPTAIAKWARCKCDLLREHLDLPNGIPRKDVFRRVLSALHPAGFQACFATWLQALQTPAAQASPVEQPILSVDGKTLRRSHDRGKGLGALHSVSVWASDFGLTLAQVMPAPKTLPGYNRWKKLKSIGLVILTRLCHGIETTEIRYYISSLDVGVKLFARAVRGHWGIENTCHWRLDVTYREDESRIRDDNARNNFAWLRRFTRSLLKQHPGKESIAMKRRGCGWDDDFLIEVITGHAT